MATFNFYLKGAEKASDYRRSTKPALVLLFASHKGNRYRLSTGQKVSPNVWDFKNQRLKATATNAAAINDFFKSLETLAESVLMAFLSSGQVPTQQQFKDEFEAQRSNTKQEITLGQAFGLFIEHHSNSLEYNTIKNYKRNQNRILEFEARTKGTHNVEKFGAKQYEAIIAYLSTELNHSKNTLADMAKTMKTVLKWLSEQEGFKDLQIPEMVVSWEVASDIYLNPLDLDQIWNLQFGIAEGRERVRDLFLIGCYTGLRYSDFHKLRLENISGNIAHIATKKTKSMVQIPIHPRVVEILEKYNGTLPKVISNQQFNSHLKVIGQMAGFNELIPKTRTNGGTQQTEWIPKWQMISTHTARRSFATNLYKLKRFSTVTCMRLTGHKTESEFMKYIKVSQEEAANEVAAYYQEKEHQTRLERA